MGSVFSMSLRTRWKQKKKGTTERWARKCEDVVREQTGIPFWNVICWFHCGIDAARRHAGQTTDRFYLFLSFSQFNYRSSQTHITADWHSVWELTSVLCLFVSVPQRVISSTNDLAGSSQMMEITEPSLPKLKQKSQPLHFIFLSFPLLSFASFTLLHLISLASIYVNYIYKTPTMPVSFLTVCHNLLPYFLFGILSSFSPLWPLCLLSIPLIYVGLLTLCLRTEISNVFVCLCERLDSFLKLMTRLVINGWKK